LNLDRTSVVAPFNAVITRRSAELGARISTQDPLATLAGTDAFWVRVSVPVDRLRWLDVPRGPGETGSPARVFAPGDPVPWEGRVIRLLGDLEARGRMARLVVEVKDPMRLTDGASHRLPLLLGSYVRVELDGSLLHDVYRIPRTALRDNTWVWVALPDRTLDIRPAEVAWRGPDAVFLSGGLSPGEEVIVSDVAIPTQGSPLLVEGEQRAEGVGASGRTGAPGEGED
jgi:multidrug efflux pump subunit AcrA (membrane-fusion protein)